MEALGSRQKLWSEGTEESSHTGWSQEKAQPKDGSYIPEAILKSE